MAEAIDNIKFLLVKGESARCVGSMKDLRRTFSDIMGFNRNLLIEIEKKSHNTKQLSESLKTLGQLINQTANVRYGKAKEQMVSACREAIKKKEFPRILTIMERGVPLP
jgi:Bardet-Biedl syndrome 2 protein